MSCIKDIVVAEPLVDVVAPEQVVTNYSTIMTINTQTCTKEDLAFEVRTPSSHTHTHTHARARACASVLMRICSRQRGGGGGDGIRVLSTITCCFIFLLTSV